MIKGSIKKFPPVTAFFPEVTPTTVVPKRYSRDLYFADHLKRRAEHLTPVPVAFS